MKKHFKSKTLWLYIPIFFTLLLIYNCRKDKNIAGVPICETEDATTDQWRTIELSFTSDTSYSDSFNELDLDVIFTHTDGAELKVPAFWNGGNNWMVRFAPTLTGVWTYNTVCTDEANTGLHNKFGCLTCIEYKGDLELYKKGFVKTTADLRYFTYDDGTPFFYLGDTHWNIPANSLANFKTIIDKRIDQGFTVIQSEPLEAGYDLSNGLKENDLIFFDHLDERFQY